MALSPSSSPCFFLSLSTDLIILSYPSSPSTTSLEATPLLLIPIANRTSGNKQNVKSSPSSIAVFKYLVPILVALVAMKYQAKNEDPFEARPINMWCFCIAICIYCLAKGRRNKIQISVENYSPIIDHVILLFGALASVSLISVLLPRIPELLSFAVIPVVLIIIAWNKHKRGCCWLCDGITNLVSFIPDIRNWSTQSNVAAQPNPSPQVLADVWEGTQEK